MGVLLATGHGGAFERAEVRDLGWFQPVECFEVLLLLYDGFLYVFEL